MVSGEIKQFPLEEEYKKSTGITPADILKLRQWLDTQPHLPSQEISDLDIILTYHCCFRSAEVSKQLLDLHFTLKTLFTNFFKDRVINKKEINNLEIVLPIPLEVRTHIGEAVFYARLINYEVKKFNFAECVRSAVMSFDLWQYEEGTWPGFVFIIDLDGVTLGHLSRLDIQTLQQFLYFVQEGLLVKLNGLHFINAPSFMDRLMMLIRPFLKKALMDVLHIHQTGTTTLEKFLPMKGLPKEAGGEYKTFEQCKDDLIAKFEANKEYFAHECKKRVTESLRPGKPKTISDIFGSVEGSFKKLDID